MSAVSAGIKGNSCLRSRGFKFAAVIPPGFEKAGLCVKSAEAGLAGISDLARSSQAAAVSAIDSLSGKTGSPRVKLGGDGDELTKAAASLPSGISIIIFSYTNFKGAAAALWERPAAASGIR